MDLLAANPKGAWEMNAAPGLDILARKLAMRYVQRDVDRGISEDYIRSSSGGSGWGQKFLDNNPGSDLEEFGAAHVGVGGYVNGRYHADKIIVSRLKGVDVTKAFSLHEIYQECRKGQLSLL